MTAVLYTDHFVQFFDDSGNPLSGGKLYAYSAGTTTPKATYTTEAADIEHANPIILDSAGRATVFIQGSYRFDLYDSGDALIKSTDNVTSFTTLNEAGDPFFQSFSGTGAQTVFTLSESLGSDSKDIMVFVDAGGTEGYEIQNPSAYTLSGTSLTFTSAPASGTDNIYVFAPTRLLGAASASAAAAAASAAAAAASAGALTFTSTSSVAIGTGSKTFTVASGLALSAGQWLIISSDASPATNYMTGQITSYSSTTLQVNIARAFGSGTLNDWSMKLSGVIGQDGATGSVSATSAVVAATSAGASLQSSTAASCISWGSGGSANSTLGGNMSGASTYKLVDMVDPTSAQDYATKAYVDSSTGAVVQVVTTQDSSSAAQTSTSSTYVAVTGASVAITPTSTSNKVLVRFSVGITAGANSGGYLRIKRGSTVIKTINAVNSASGSGGTPAGGQVTIEALDSPATTSATTYTMEFARDVVQPTLASATGTVTIIAASVTNRQHVATEVA